MRPAAPVADIDAFIEALGDLHRARRREAEFARGFLLQGRGGEGRVGVALDRLRLDRRRPRIGAVSSAALKASASAPEPTSSRLIFLPSAPTRRAVNGGAGLGLQMGEDRPIFARDEFLDLELAVADDAQRHRLHAAGRARARQLAPQHRREVEADEISRARGGRDRRRPAPRRSRADGASPRRPRPW